jgi:hypothetical protein
VTAPALGLDELLGAELAALRSRAIRIRVTRALACGLGAATLMLIVLQRAPSWSSGPLVAWAVVLAGVACGWLWHRGVRHDDAGVAAAVETDQQLRRGEVRVAREAARTGPLGAFAANQLASRLHRIPSPRATSLAERTRSFERRALSGLAVVLAAFALTGARLPASVHRLTHPFAATTVVAAPEAPAVASGATASVLVTDIAARVRYPEYLGRPEEAVALAGTLILPRGATIDIRASAPVGGAPTLVPERGQRIPFARDNDVLTARIVAQQSGRWRWALGDDERVAGLPGDFVLDVRPDSAPSVDLGSTSDTLLTAGGEVELDVLAQDDHADRVSRRSRGGAARVAQRAVAKRRCAYDAVARRAG